MIRRYRKKPVVIEAMQLYVGITPRDIHSFLGQLTDVEQAYEMSVCSFGFVQEVRINTLEGTMVASPLTGDYIIKGIAGEFYPCKPDIFKATYEAVGAEAEPDA